MVRRATNLLGFEFYRIDRDAPGRDPYLDIRRLVTVLRPVVFDVGANQGETIRAFQKYLPDCTIHAFEPAPETYRVLCTATSSAPNVILNNVALGSAADERPLLVSSLSGMTSLLQSGKDYWGNVIDSVPVRITTIDAYRSQNKIERIDVIKLDTQGFDLEVLRGSAVALAEGSIHLILIEIIFSEIYSGCPRPEEVLSFMRANGFRLIAFYGCHTKEGFACWTDALFARVPGPDSDERVASS